MHVKPFAIRTQAFFDMLWGFDDHSYADTAEQASAGSSGVSQQRRSYVHKQTDRNVLSEMFFKSIDVQANVGRPQ